MPTITTTTWTELLVGPGYITIAPGANGSVRAETSPDGVAWAPFGIFSASRTLGTPDGATRLRAIAIGVEGSFSFEPLRVSSEDNPRLALLRNGIARASGGNPLTLAQWAADEAWAPTTAYSDRRVVSNGGNAYICSTAGTSAGAGGPTGTSGAPVVDGTAQWIYLRPAVAAALTGAPTVAVSSTDLSATYTKAYSTSTTTAFWSGSKLLRNENFNVIGGLPANRFGAAGIVSINLTETPALNATYAAAGMSSHAADCGWQFMTDAPAVLIVLWQTTSGRCRLIVDGRYYSTSQMEGQATRTSVLVTFNNPEVRNHTVTVEPGNNGVLQFVAVQPAYSVWAPPKTGPVIYLQGNSYIQGTSTPAHSCGTILRHLLGAHSVVNGAIGGVGLDTVYNGTTAQSFKDRISEIVEVAPDIIVWQDANFNAGGAYPAGSTAAQNLRRDYMLALRSQPNLRNVPVFAISGWGSATNNPAAYDFTAENDFATGIAAAGTDPLTFVIRQNDTGTEPWVRGTGRVGATTGTGNSDIYTGTDGTHPSVAGYDYYYKRIAEAIANAVGLSTVY